MKLQSLSLSFRIPLAFHAMNNEGVSGNVMEPRRITINEAEYDGISGEMMRRHVLENFVRLCGERAIPLAEECRGLVPERSKVTLREWIRNNKNIPSEKEVKQFTPAYYSAATTALIQQCALSDLGGYLIPFGTEDKVKGTLKRDSCFEVGWLITEDPAVVEFTQGVAYNPDPSENRLFTSNMRVGVYSGVFRFDLGRVGRSDWEWLNPSGDADALDEGAKKQRINALLDALEQWLLSPGGARQAGWLPHQSDLREGVFCLAQSGPAPFVSPLAINLADKETPVSRNENFRASLKALVEKRVANLTCHEFNSLAGMADAFDAVRAALAK